MLSPDIKSKLITVLIFILTVAIVAACLYGLKKNNESLSAANTALTKSVADKEQIIKKVASDISASNETETVNVAAKQQIASSVIEQKKVFNNVQKKSQPVKAWSDQPVPSDVVRLLTESSSAN